MPHDVVDDPVSRLSFGFERRGDVLHADTWAEPGAKVAAHVRPPAEERFAVVEGDVVFRVDGRETAARTGDRVTAPAGVRHGSTTPARAARTSPSRSSPRCAPRRSSATAPRSREPALSRRRAGRAGFGDC